jgi:DNA-binding protein H-NS
MKKINLDKLTLPELQALNDNIATQIKVKREEEKQTIRDKAAKMARDAGFDLSEIVSPSGQVRKKRAYKSPNKIIKNPQNPSQTWTGRGRRPHWVIEQGLA